MQFDAITLFPAGTTGTPNSPTVPNMVRQDTLWEVTVEAVGGTPTATFRIQGSSDGTNWVDVESMSLSGSGAGTNQTVTATGTYLYIIRLNLAPRWFIPYLRLACTANTNVTFRARVLTQPIG